ncbi:PLD nuclease N-terminal domain-containing protein [Microbacterium halophytorum]|uniref:PLD nuclease N-terminal domain-containing protein n=1 Tax=Microbacterium halophytorum TaxID=2067568 RepID=UPI000CFDE0B6|nr:PLD nuclease N-terminal domain-containing protein [Microbacterium halophytorum]
MARLLLIGAVAAVVFTVISIIDCAVQPATRHRGAPKGVWILITCVPVIGGILWWTIGRSRGATGSFRVPNAPDDDPSFLSETAQKEADDRIRQLEEELRKLDEEEAEQGADDAAHGDERSPSRDDESPDADEPDDKGTGGRSNGTGGHPDAQA